MFILVTGGSGSGKSEFAENYACKFKGDKVYIATMQPFGSEDRIERHRKMREGKGFRTVECYGKLDVDKADVFLLECVSNFTANMVFSLGIKSTDEIIKEILNLNCKTLVAVTNEIFSDGIEYDNETEEYMRILGEVNRGLAKVSDEVYEVVYGRAVRIK